MRGSPLAGASRPCDSRSGSSTNRSTPSCRARCAGRTRPRRSSGTVSSWTWKPSRSSWSTTPKPTLTSPSRRCATRDHRWRAMIEGRWEELGGEPPDEFRARIVPCVDAVIDRFPGGRVAAVCHGGVINVYVAALLGLERHLWFEPGYTSITRVAAARSGERSVVTLNETAHLVATLDAKEEPA
ncbi:MAG TPA: histidine phosphatase family protein [Acidimicrobiia bacterium]|nr:histidine phosphatase family protein [Acidimicrobiia bacterium]